MIQKREIVTAIILTIITCGIYGIIWFINLTDDVARISEDTEFSGGKAFIFTLLTCGIYGFFWAYKIGKDLYIAQTKRNMIASDNSTLFLILQIFGLSIITYGLVQSELNKMADMQNSTVSQN